MALTQVSPGLLDSQAAAPTFRNRIINGAMMIDQRNAGASVSTSSGSVIYTVDRWAANFSQASKYTIQRNAGSVTPPAGFTNYLGATSSASTSLGASDFFMLNQRIEGFNVADLGWGAAGAQSVTLSFWVRSSLTGTFGGVITNSAQNRSYPFTYSILSANTWEQKSVTITGDTSGTWLSDSGIGMFVNFGLGVGSTYSGTAGSWAGANYYSATGATSVVGTNGATFYITGVQLEVGSVATPFEHRLYGVELALCQRYYQTAPVLQQNTVGYFISYYGGSNAICPDTQTQVQMRATPAGNFSSASIEYYSFGGVWTATTMTIYGASVSSFFIYAPSDGDGRTKLIRTSSGGTAPAPYYTLNAEL